MERYLSTESNGLRRKIFQLDNFRNFQSKISRIWKFSDKSDRNFVAFGIKTPPSDTRLPSPDISESGRRRKNKNRGCRSNRGSEA
jgi:hypothetical protein